MPRRRIFAALTAGAVLALSATASAGGTGNDYQGRAEHDPGTYVGFDLVKKDGKTRLKNVISVLGYHCGTDNPTFGTATMGSLKVDSKKHFKGTLRIPIASRGSDAKSAKTEISGKLGKHGKATGIIQDEVVFTDIDTRGAPTGRCYTGGLHFKVRKGAEVPVPQIRAGRRLR